MHHFSLLALKYHSQLINNKNSVTLQTLQIIRLFSARAYTKIDVCDGNMITGYFVLLKVKRKLFKG